MDLIARQRGCLLGLACGDAVGTTVEFRTRGTFTPVTDMTGGGPFNLPVGAWTDDTSMALCLATSLLERREFDPVDQMERYCCWQDEGFLSSTGRCFDIGITVRAALDRFRRTHEPYSGSTSPNTAGNGSIMRLAPIPIAYQREPDEAVRRAADSSRTTHGATECLEACQLLAQMTLAAFAGKSKQTVLLAAEREEFESPKVRAIARGEYRTKSSEQIVGSGYVIASLEAAAWCFGSTATFREAILAATNLGDDADTTAAVCGQLAGAFYGEGGIPDAWLAKLTMAAEIGRIAEELASLKS